MADTEFQIKGTAFSSFSILDKVAKLQDNEGYLTWKREITKVLKMIELWTFIQQPNEPGQVTRRHAWISGHERTCNVLRYVVNGDAFDEIEHHTNASEAWSLLESIFKPRGAGFLNDALQRLDCLKLADCESPAEYISQFRGIVNELRSFSSKFKLDENFLIYRFQSSLGSEHSSYFERYAQEHDPFTEDGEAKYTLSSAMQHFRNTVKNPSSRYATSQIGTVALTAQTPRPSVSYLAPNQPSVQRTIQNGVKPGVNQRVLRVEKTVKYCTYCHRDYHTEDECHEKFPHLRTSSSTGHSQIEAGKATATGKRKRQRTNGGTNASALRDKSDHASFFAMPPELGCFMATSCSSSMKLSSVWIWDSANSRHICHDRSAFITFRPLTDQPPITGLGGSMSAEGEGEVHLTCKSLDGKPQVLMLNKVQYMPRAGVNLISQGQIHREGLHKLEIISQGIRVGASMFARLVDNNLYLMDTFSPGPLALAAINKDTLDIWHSRLGHLGHQNIIRLAHMSKGIDLSKPPPQDVCIPCTEANMRVEPHTDMIQPGQQPLDLVHSDVSGPHTAGLYGAKYYVTFLCDATKRSEAILLKEKSGVLPAFKGYCLRNEKGDKRVRRLRTDGGGEYDSKDFTEFRDEKGIIWEPIIPGNPQMNGTAERLGQTLHRMANALLKDSGFPTRYWPELILTANYLRNREPVVGRDITPFEADTGRPPSLGHLRRIGQRGVAQLRKPATTIAKNAVIQTPSGPSASTPPGTLLSIEGQTPVAS